jgi:hypothetical protein
MQSGMRFAIPFLGVFLPAAVAKRMNPNTSNSEIAEETRKPNP